MKRKTMIILAVIAAILLGSYSTLKGKYNTFVSKNQAVEKSWSQVENVLQRRNDLIPNLVNTVKGYAAHEEGVFTQVTEARAKLSSANTVPEKVAAANALSGAMFNLMAVSERYPELKANQNFLALQDELSGTENRIAIERRRFNEVVEGYNTFAGSFPNNFFATFFGMEREKIYFKAAEGAKSVPTVDFNN